jgi:hypothetical protein
MLAVAMLPHDEGGGEGQVPCRIGDEVQPHKAHVLVRNKVDEDLWGHLGRSFSEQIIFENYSSIEQPSYA